MIAALLGVSLVEGAAAQTACVIQEERRWRTLTAHFSVGSLKATITLPTAIVSPESLTAFLEVSRDSSGPPESAGEVFMEAEGQRVPVRNGAAFHLTCRAGERLRFTLSAADGQTLCSWQPSLRRRQGRQPEHAASFSRVDSWFFRKTGEPIALWVGVDESRQFTIDGAPAMVLARTPWEVILRDPQPAVGQRTVASDGNTIALRFIDIETSFSAPSSDGRATLAVRVPSFELWGRWFWPPFWKVEESTTPIMWLFNFKPDVVQLICGQKPASGRLDLDNDEVRQIRITGHEVRGGGFDFTCPIRYRKQAEPGIEVVFFEPSPIHLPPHTGRRRVSPHWPGKPPN
jgi:hypothetical protein